MSSLVLRNIMKIAVFCLFSVFMTLLYLAFYGEKISKKQAIVVCAKIVNDYITSDFNITDTYFKKYYSLSQAKIELYITYSNGKRTSTDCFIQRNIKDNIIKINTALIVDNNGKLVILDDIKVLYN